jgi:hypothetical protein
LYEKADTQAEKDLAFKRLGGLVAEHLWVDLQRPFYNVWPFAVELSQQVKLNLPFSAITLPFEALLLRFARGHEPQGVTTAILFWRPNRVQLTIDLLTGSDRLQLEMRFTPEDQVELWMDRLRDNPKGAERIVVPVIQLVVFIGLLAHDHDTITPLVLSKDQRRYESTESPDERKWLEDRAARRMGRGFDVCKKLDLERSTSPHWRNPHPCLFWIGPGRSEPIIKMRSGAVIQRVGMADVPTGYLGPEKEDELDPIDAKTPREGISKSRRFDVMNRDGFRCQLCGATQEQGAVLHVDHKVPLAKGGSNEYGNLWTLCDLCNLGKSDKTVL